MKSRIMAISLFIFTTAAVFLYPMYRDHNAANAGTRQTVPLEPELPVVNQQAKIEAVFVLDTTGSMGGLIEAAREKIWSIASSMASADPAPEIRLGLVAYRDRGDDYVTRTIDLSDDLDSVYSRLMAFQAAGGGDGPESVNQALYEAVNGISWSRDQDTYRVVFLVGDAPPHMDYQDDVKYTVTMELAKEKNIFINTIQCGTNNRTTPMWQHIAQLGNGKYFRVDQSGSAVAINTPFDKKIAEVSRALDDTHLLYGSKEEKDKQQERVLARESIYAGASDASMARRSEFNLKPSGRKNLFGGKDLLEEVVVTGSGAVDLSGVRQEELPEVMQAMSPAEQEEFVAEKSRQRKQLVSELRQLNQQRSDYISNEISKRDGIEDSLDEKIYGSVTEQAGSKGYRFDAEAPAY